MLLLALHPDALRAIIFQDRLTVLVTQPFQRIDGLMVSVRNTLLFLTRLVEGHARQHQYAVVWKGP